MELDIHQAQRALSRLLKHVAMGEEFTITKGGKAVAKLVPVDDKWRKFRLGSAKGEFTVPDDFNDPLPKEIEDSFWK
jgi:prevent-host-death family protein